MIAVELRGLLFGKERFQHEHLADHDNHDRQGDKEGPNHDPLVEILCSFASLKMVKLYDWYVQAGDHLDLT